ncbi:hypothetical protein RRG08_019084 [Elysia crispata]|uniref:Uncharacterized protein n=1 Tax=Elysia crispata TaxID=231223 RepID=A0AAE1A571_9GAST|nr:hypothetical protein RRG08_019084 [Elysia crispata]
MLAQASAPSPGTSCALPDRRIQLPNHEGRLCSLFGFCHAIFNQLCRVELLAGPLLLRQHITNTSTVQHAVLLPVRHSSTRFYQPVFLRLHVGVDFKQIWPNSTDLFEEKSLVYRQSDRVAA